MDDPLYKRYPVESKDYKLYEAIGEGYSATVHRALCTPFNEIVAIKVLDLERCNNDLDGIRREVHTMSLIEHPKVLRALCSFTTGHHLWVVMPYMAGGSCLHIMKSSFPEGFEEPVIATLLHETLMALDYLHAHGHIHRDVKAGNILLDSDGSVKLADFGVSACMFDRGDRHQARNTFVGTPCWMAPEVMQQKPSYGSRVDIWSFGITALELAHGHAPFSKYPPMKVFLMTLQSAPPGFDSERDRRFSKSFKDMVAKCLVKDPKKRPRAGELLKHNFFKSAKTQEYLAQTILKGLSPLGERFKILKEKDAKLLDQNKALHGDKEQISKQEYIRGVSAWNFDLKDMKNQAALIHDNGSTSSPENVGSYWNQNQSTDDVSSPVGRPSPDTTGSNSGPSYEDGFDDTDSFKGSLVSFPNQPLQALNGSFDIVEEDANAKGPSCDGSAPSDSEMQSPPSENHQTRRYDFDNLSQDTSLPQNLNPELKKSLSGPLLPENVVQHKGRFKITSADVSPKSSTSGLSNHGSGNSAVQVAPNVSAASILPSLQLILQQNDTQKEEIIKLITHVEQSFGNSVGSDVASTSTSNAFQASPVARDGSLRTQVIHLQQRIGSLVEELQRQKLKNAQLERQLSALARKE